MPSAAGPETDDPLPRWRIRCYELSTRFYRPNPANTALTWIPEERIAVGAMPTAPTMWRLRDAGVTHVVNCREAVQTWLSQDLAVERALFGPARVAHAPMFDLGLRQHPRRWSAAAHFAARALDDDPAARVLIHCFGGSHRSVLVAYAVLRLRGRSAEAAADLILGHRAEAELLSSYRASVEDWLAAGAPEMRR